ncbi:MAG: T9SS type A sorting domain-containing protein, partial [Bacteroidota bacterium]
DNTNTWLQGNLIGNNGALPVEWTAFDAVVDGQAVVLTWETATETDNAGFAVERLAFDVAGERGAGSEWSEVGFVEGAGTTVEAQRYAFRLMDQAIGRHQFRLRQVDFSGEVSYSSVVEVVVEVPGAYVLSDAYPNPFNPQAMFTLAVAERQRVTVDLFDALGRSVQTLHKGELAANQTHRFTLDGSRLPSGVYLYRVAGESFVESRRVTLVK